MQNKAKIWIIIIIIVIILSIITLLKVINQDSNKTSNVIQNMSNNEIYNNSGENYNYDNETSNSPAENIVVFNSKNQKFNKENNKNVIAILTYSIANNKNDETAEKYYIYKNENGKYFYDRKTVYSDTSSEQLITTKEITNADNILNLETEYIKRVKDSNKHIEEMYPTGNEKEYLKETLFIDYVYLDKNGKEIKINKEDLIEKILENDENNTEIKKGFNIANITYDFYGDATDSGTIIQYKLFANNDGTYHYDKQTSNITIAGQSNPISVENGEIKSKDDLLKIDNSMRKRPEKSEEMYLAVRYIFNYANGWVENVETIENLLNKLF